MELKFIKIILFVLLPLMLTAQKEANNWFFGERAGINFSSGAPLPDTNGSMIIKNNSTIHCATISDKNGNLQFYTDGNTVWNKVHNIMVNGTGILSGGPISDVLILPLCGQTNIYYIFTCCYYPMPAYNYGMRYSIVDMSKNGGLGEVISKNNFLFLNSLGSLTAVRHSDGRSVWIIAHHYDSNFFYAYLLNAGGLNTIPVISKAGSNFLGTPHDYSVMKNSPDGRFLTLSTAPDGITELFHFNYTSGVVTYLTNLQYQSYSLSCLGMEYSPDGSRLYLSGQYHPQPNVYIKLHLQYDLSLPTIIDIRNSYQTIGNHQGTMQLGSDGKIYITQIFPPYNQYYLAAINNPNKRGTACNYSQNVLYLGGRKCTGALPTFMQSYFFKPDFMARPLCFGDSTHFLINDTNQLDSVFWNFGNPSTGINNTSTVFKPSHKFSDTGTYRVSVLVYHKGTADTTFRDLRISFPPKATFTVNDSLQCFKSNKFIFSNNSVIQSGSMTWEWDFGDSATAYAKDTSHSYIADNTYNIKLVALSDYGCSDTFSKNIVVYRSPNAKFEIYDSAQCLERNNFAFINKTALFNNKFKCLWDFGDSLTSAFVNPSHQYKYADTFTVTLVVSDSFGCADTFTKNTLVHVHPKPLSNFIIIDSNQCLSGNNFLFANTSTIKSGTFKQLWNFGDNNNGITFNANHSYIKEDTFSVKLLLVSDKGCKDSIIKVVYIHPDPIAKFTINDTTQCISSNNFLFTNQSSYPQPFTFKYLWLFGDGNTDTTANPLHNYINTGNYQVKLLIKSAGNCSDSFTKTITVLTQPNVKYGVNDTVQCLKANLFQFANTTIGANSYKWDFGDGNSDTTKNPNHSYLATGIYVTRLISQSSVGCMDTSNLKLTVLEVPKVAFSVNDTSQLLSVNSFVFSNLTNCKPASSTCKFLWDFGDSQSDTINNPTHSYSAIGKYHVLLTSISANGCKDTVSLLVNVFNIIVNTAFTVKDVCLGDYAFFKNSSTIQFDSFQKFIWDFGDGNKITQPNPQYLYADTGTYKIQMISVSYGGYKDTTYGKVIVFPSPTVEIIATPDSILEQGIKATLSVNGSYDSLLWSTGAITASIVVEKTGIYSIRVVDANGCDATDQITIEYLPEKPFGAMNVITPNGDGINDVWKVWNIEKYQPCKLAIYNRWGDELFSTNDYNNNWNGKYKGKSLPEGTYYYVLITMNGKVYKGAVNVMK